MEKHNEGFNRGVKEVLKNKNLSGICGALGQVITTEEAYEKGNRSCPRSLYAKYYNYRSICSEKMQ